MTVIVQYEPEVTAWTGNGSLGFTFEAIGAQAIEVWAEAEDTDNPGTFLRDKVPPGYYTLAFAGSGWVKIGGIVVLARGIIGDKTERISIERNTPIQQLVDYQNFESFPMKSIEFAVDRATMIIQELAFRKCGTGITGDIDQLIEFEAYGVLYATSLDFVLDKLVDYMVEMDANGQDCSSFLEGTGANYNRSDNSGDNGLLNFGYQTGTL